MNNNSFVSPALPNKSMAPYPGHAKFKVHMPGQRSGSWSNENYEEDDS